MSTTSSRALDLAERVDQATAASPGRSLRRGSLRFLRTVALPVDIQGPTAVLGSVLYRAFAPFPAAPFSWIVLAASASVILGVATLLVPGLLTRMRGSRVLAVTATAVTGPAARPR